MFACQEEEGGKKSLVNRRLRAARVRARVVLRADSTRVVSSSGGLRASSPPRTPEPRVEADGEPPRHKEPMCAQTT